MCSIVEDDFGDQGGAHAMPSDPIFRSTIISNEICKKCNERRVVVKINLKDAQCELCFFQYVRRIFRASLGTTRIVERFANVAIIFDGTNECCILFDMLRYSLSQEEFKRLTYKPFAIFVDDTAAFELDIEKRNNYVRESLKYLKQFDFESYYASTGNSSNVVKLDNFEDFHIPELNIAGDNEFHKAVNSIKSLTSRDDFVLTARSNAIRAISDKLNCKYAFLATICHQITANLLTNVALGRGASLANHTSFCDDRIDCQVKLLRPIRKLTALEVETYIRLDKIVNWPTVNHNYFSMNSNNPNASIQNLTKHFIGGLQENFASTVSTIFRTGDKITATTLPKTTSEMKSCKFCHSLLDYNDSTTLFAIEYSRCVSACADRNEVNDFDLMTKRANDAVQGNLNGDESDDVKSIWKDLCHGCRNMFRDFNDESSLIDQIK